MNSRPLAMLACVSFVCALQAQGIPTFQVDAAWPRPLPNKWAIGQVTGIAIGPQDHVWILHRPSTLADDEKLAASNPPAADCCIPAPPVIEYDAGGKVVRAWGGPGPGYEWPKLEHGFFVDYKTNVWIAGNTGTDAGRILKFTADGRFLMSIGKPLGPGEKASNNSRTSLGRQPADLYVDPRTNDLYVADGDGGDRRIIVFDAETGAFRRLWGAYGERPVEGPAAKYDPGAPPSKSFSSGVHCVTMSNDGLVYVCDRNADRIQVFRPDGRFVKEVYLSPKTIGQGTAFDIAFSPDQAFLYVADGTDQKVWILRRDTLQVVGSFGQLGHSAGEFRNVHALTVDSAGNLYAAEVSENKRIQKFALRRPGVSQ